MDAGIAKAVARAKSGVVLCFMDHEATSKETVDAGKDENGALSTRWIPGPVRHMKVVKDEAAHRQIYEKVRAISLFVMKLPMYLICESLADVSPELGCTEALAPSWSEIQSVWLRMGSRVHGGFAGRPLRRVLRGYGSRKGLGPFRDPKVMAARRWRHRLSMLAPRSLTRTCMA